MNYSRRILSRAFFTFLFSTLSLSSCGASAVLGISPGEAADKLKEGDIGFILSAEAPKVKELSRLNPSAPFYAGLLTEAAGDKVRSTYLFEAALGSPVLKVKKEAARKLIPLLAEIKDRDLAERILRLPQKPKPPEGEELITLRGAALYVLDRHQEAFRFFQDNPKPENQDPWDRAFRFLSDISRREPGSPLSPESGDFLLGSAARDAASPAYRWAYGELLRRYGNSLPGVEKTAGAGRLAVAEEAYTAALLHFENVRQIQPGLLFRRPALLNDIGRSYMGISSRREEGFKLLTGWESALRTGKNSPAPELSAAELREARYSLLFYAARIRRQQGRHGEAAELFTRALALAPNPVQEDSCVWYILSSTFTEKPENTAALVKTYASRWHVDDEFYDILDRLACYLVTEKKWGDLGDVFAQIRKGKDGATIAKYAYLMGRAVSLGYASGGGMSAGDYFTIAYREGNASFYYRALAASYLGKTLTPGTRVAPRQRSGDLPNGAELEFYAKFFDFGAASYAMPYLRKDADRYTNQELRTLAKTFAGAGRYLESIQIVGMYMRRDGYEMETADLELYYPKPFTHLIEKHALANGLHPQVFFGLIRTESAFTPSIASHAGAIGLAQLMPFTAKEVAGMIKRRGGPDYTGGNIDLTNPEINVQLGAVYLKSLTDRLGSPMLALLAYNGGPSRILRLRRAAPSLPEDIFIETIDITETRNYGKRVMAAAAAYGYLYYGMSMHDVVSGIFK
ncbi:MAG: transglycosylase SLT domain-containing protein [Treponema sp.]|jgi:soluble lytic murein transglycosylase|nr:transglycosylase SLT domain-containing protein [Treponema sp.]